jgi:hypothetical protein
VAAPVNVARSTTASGRSSWSAYASASASTSRPSASVLSTSTVRPPYIRSTSPGRYAVALGMFSAIGTVAVTATGSSSSAASTVAAMTAAAPPMSEVIWSMFAAGLIEIPPVSNVTPLPISATFARGDGPPE